MYLYRSSYLWLLRFSAVAVDSERSGQISAEAADFSAASAALPDFLFMRAWKKFMMARSLVC